MEFGFYRRRLATAAFRFVFDRFFTARGELHDVLFLALSVTFSFFSFISFVCEVSREPLNGFAPNLQTRSAWSIARTSLNVSVKG